MHSLCRLPDLLGRLTFGFGGGVLLWLALQTAARAQLHMAIAGQICGSNATSTHCGWCAATVAFTVAGLGALAFGSRPAAARRPVRI